jgi:hypothetical protein
MKNNCKKIWYIQIFSYLCILNQLKQNKMVRVKILKNGNSIKQFTCPINMQQKYFDFAFDIAGGMWNGKDKFEVEVTDILK